MGTDCREFPREENETLEEIEILFFKSNKIKSSQISRCQSREAISQTRKTWRPKYIYCWHKTRSFYCSSGDRMSKYFKHLMFLHRAPAGCFHGYYSFGFCKKRTFYFMTFHLMYNETKNYVTQIKSWRVWTLENTILRLIKLSKEFLFISIFLFLTIRSICHFRGFVIESL